MAERRGRPLNGQDAPGVPSPRAHSPGGSPGRDLLLGGGAGMEAEGGGKGRRREGKRREGGGRTGEETLRFPPRREPIAPLMGRGPVERGAPPSRARWFRPAEGPRGGRRARRGPRAAGGGRSGPGAWGGGLSLDPAPPGAEPSGPASHSISQKFGGFANAARRFPLSGLARTVSSPGLRSGNGTFRQTLLNHNICKKIVSLNSA